MAFFVVVLSLFNFITHKSCNSCSVAEISLIHTHSHSHTLTQNHTYTSQHFSGMPLKFKNEWRRIREVKWRKKTKVVQKKKGNKNHIYRNLKHLSVIVTIRYVSCMALGKMLTVWVHVYVHMCKWMCDDVHIYELYEWMKWSDCLSCFSYIIN